MVTRIGLNKIATGVLYGSAAVIISTKLYSKIKKNDAVEEVGMIIAGPIGMMATGYIWGSIINTPNGHYLYK